MTILGKRFFVGKLRPESFAWLPSPVNILLILLVAYNLARLTWNLAPVPTSASFDPINFNTQPTQASTIDGSENSDYSAIANWHLFGKINEQRLPAQPVINAPETRLNLKLAGIFYSQDNAKALAIIAEGNSPEHGYAIGEMLTGGVRLEQILRDKVILSRNGQLETLSLPIESQDGTNSGLAPQRTNPQTSILQTPNATPGAAQTVNAGIIASQLREAVATRPDALQDLAYADPYVQNGQFIGFRLRPGRNRQLLGQLGLRSGDIITEINGTALDNPAQGFTLLQEMMQADQITAKILRNGAEIPFTFQIQ